jgi:hypothetical protein
LETLTTARQSASGNTISLANGIDGGSTDIIQNGGRTGDQITWAIRNRDYLLKQIADGTLLVPSEGGSLYFEDPSIDSEGGERGVEFWAIYPNYEDGVRQTQDEDTFATVKHYFKGTLTPQDDSEGGSTITTVNYLMDCASRYADPDAGYIANPEGIKMTITDYRNWILPKCLIKGLSAGIVEVKPATGASFGGSTLNMVANQVAYNTLGTTPTNASGYSVSFSALTTLTDLSLSYDPDSRRVRIHAGTTTGTEVITVTLTNGNAPQSTVTATFTIVVA